MKSIITGDGSTTLYSDKYKEYYHSKSGAIEEAVKKFVIPCRIAKLAKSGHIKILDVGFGLGYNAIAAIDIALEMNPSCEVEIISLEKELILNEIIRLNPRLQYYSILKKLHHDPITHSYSCEDKNIFLKIKISDAVKSVKHLNLEFDAVFHDPFSPDKNPELWTEVFFKDVYAVMKKGAILATYSYARKIRDNLKKAGFCVRDGPLVGRRSPSTIAVKP